MAKQNNIVKVSDLITQKKNVIARMCETSDQAKSFFAGIHLAFADNKSLQDCLQSDDGRRSVTRSLEMVASTGLSLNPQKEEAALIAYKGKCSFQIMKEGYVKIAMKTGRVQYIGSDVVRENDTFSIKKSMNGDTFDFSPARKNRGEIDGFFAGIEYMDDNGKTQSRVEYMTAEQMEEHRDKYRADKWASKDKQKNGAWSTSFEGMGRKTVLKRLLINNKISDKIKEHLSSEDQSYIETHETDEDGFATATVIPAEEIAADIENQNETQSEQDPF